MRALAVVAVLLHHLAPQRFGHAYLGVDVFFVISGCVVSRSIAARCDRSGLDFLKRFYWRRWRRLWPALALMVLVVSLLYAGIGSPMDDLYTAVFRTGLTSLFGVSNLYLYRQGFSYFGLNDDYNPFLHTWSLGVEEQFYLVWPLLMLACGFGLRQPSAHAFRRLAWCAALIGLISLVGALLMLQRGSSMAVFYLVPFRLWELALGCLAFLAHRSLRSDRRLSRVLKASPLPLDLAVLVGLVVLLFLAGSESILITLAVVTLSAILLVILQSDCGGGRLLSMRLPVAIGLASYSLYLWHWPLIVLARSTLGLGPRALALVLPLIAVAAFLSFKLEFWLRYRAGWLASPRDGAAMVLGSLLLSSAGLWLLQGPAKGSFFLGRRSSDLTLATANKQIPGTSIGTSSCFLDPERPVPPGSYFSWLCRAGADEGQPLIYFEGDSHAHALLILGHELLKTGRYGVSFATRGGCPFPFFSSPDQRDDRGARYRLCRPHYLSRLRELSQVLRPGDVVVSVSSLATYLGPLSPSSRRAALSDYAASVEGLDRVVRQRGARLVLMAPTPTFPQPRIRIPLSLCRQEWFRPIWSLPPGCRTLRQARAGQLERARPLLRLQRQLAAASGTISVFDPMPALCSPGRDFCRSVEDGTLLYSDGSHLTNAGALRLRADLLALLARLAGRVDRPAERPSL